MEKIEITEEKDISLFGRKEIKGTIYSELFPSREELSITLSEKFSVPKENVKIKKIQGNFGSNTFSIEANLYNSSEDKEFLEVKKKKEKAVEKALAEAAKTA